MPIHITVDAAAAWATNKWIAYQNPQITEERKTQIVPSTKYNLLVTAFNASTVVLVMAVAAAILFAYTAAVALGAIAVFTRLMTDRELCKYTLPPERPPAQLPAQPPAQPPAAENAQQQQPPAQPAGAGAALWGRVRDAISPLALLRHSLNMAPQQEKEDNIFTRLGTRRPENWVENEVFIFDYAVWKNKVPVPEAPAAPAVEAAH